MYRLTCDIVIGKYRFRKAHKVRIEKGIKRLVSGASIVLPNVKTFLGNPAELDRLINVGDTVSIKLGYDGNNREEFTGYVAEKNPNVPFEFRCEDEMWKLRQRDITKTWESITLKSLLKFLVPDIILHPSVWDITLEDFRIDRANVVQVLDKLKQSYGLAIFYRGGKVHATLPYYPLATNNKVKYHFQKNVIKSSLQFRTGENYKLKVRAISLFPDNKKFEVNIGDATGDETTLHFYKLDRDQLIKQAEQRLKILKTTGYRGTFLTFGIPAVDPGDIAVFKDNHYPERVGENFVDDVVIDWGVGGFRQIVTPGLKANAAGSVAA